LPNTFRFFLNFPEKNIFHHSILPAIFALSIEKVKIHS